MNYSEDMKAIIRDGVSKHAWSYAELERQSGLNHGTAKRVYDGSTTEISDDNAEKICRALGIDFVAFWMLSRKMITKEQLLSGGYTKKGVCMDRIGDPELSHLVQWLNQQSPDVIEVIKATARIHGYGTSESKLARAG